MTLDTTIWIPGPINIDELQKFCAGQLGIPEGISWYQEPSSVAAALTLLTPRERTPEATSKAHLSILYRIDPLGNARSVQVCWTTGSLYHGPGGQTAVELHDQLTAELGDWLDSHDLLWHRQTLT